MIEWQNISKIYQIGDNRIPAVNGMSLTIDDGELVAIIGASGSGKTTMMNILGLLDVPTTGKYYLAGRDVSTLSSDERAQQRNHSIGFIFQFYFLLPRLTALQNVGLPLHYRGVNEAEIKRLARVYLEKVGMEKYGNHRPNQLSGGQQQRVAIARALVGGPHIILADEPTGALDSKTGQDVMNLLKDFNKAEKAIIIVVTHNDHIAEQCGRIIRVSDGKIISVTKPPPEAQDLEIG